MSSEEHKQDSSGKVTYRGNCHCRKFKFSVKLPPITKAVQCDCSLCTRKGYLVVYPETDADVVVESGEGELATYAIGNKIMQHKFCPTCGTPIFIQGALAYQNSSLAVNIRTFRYNSVNLDTLEIDTYNGSALGNPYKPFTPPESKEASTDKPHHIYSGSCQCQAITYTINSPSFEPTEITSCNCSFCSRNASLWIYPPLQALTLHSESEKNLSTYVFGSKRASHSFCRHCGCDVLNRIRLHEGSEPDVLAINARTLDGIELGRLKVVESDGWGRVEAPYLPYERDDEV